MSQSGSYTAGGGGGGSLNTLTGNSGGAVSPTAGNINIIGSGGVLVAGNPGTHTLTITAPGGGSGITTLDGDSGSATGSTVTIAGGSNINTSATAATVTVDLDNTVSISGSMTAGTGLTATTGDVTITAGNLDLPVLGGGGTRGAITVGGSLAWTLYNGGLLMGASVGNITTSGSDNVLIGESTAPSLTGANNTIIGVDAGFGLTASNFNTVIGVNALSGGAGSSNIAVGHSAGAIYNAGESNNISIGNLGVAADSGVIRIGTNATHVSTFLQGAYGVTPAMSINMMTIGSDGELGSQAIPAGGGITTLDGDSGSATGSTVTIAGGSNITTSATSATVTVDLDSTVSISGSMTAGTGFSATTGDVAIVAGNIDLPLTTAAGDQGVVTMATLRFLSSDTGGSCVYLGLDAGDLTLGGGGSVGIGQSALGAINGGGSSVGIGLAALGSMDTGTQNNAIGFESQTLVTNGVSNNSLGAFALNNLLTGSFNIAIGDNAGTAYVGAESNNIVIGSALGTVGDTGVIRIGDSGGGSPQTSCFIAGIQGVTPAMSPQMVTIGTDGEMGSQALPTGGFTWSEQTGTTQAMAVNNGYILNNAGLVTATLPATAAQGTVMRIGGKGTGGWLMAQNSGQTVHFGSLDTTTGAGGSIASTNRYDSIEILCITADTDFLVLSSVGNMTIV